MLIGVDFDNTIVCYDALFHKVARERNLIPDDLPVNKSEVRNYLRKIGKEDVWTEMQGYVYGGRMSEAAPYPGVIEFFKICREAGVEVRIISHKTRHPFLGEKYDLHKAAYDWLEQQGFFDKVKIGLPREKVFFELTKQEKLQRIGQCGCTHFIDDLPELLAEPSFPQNVKKILFDSNNLYAAEKFVRMRNWSEAPDLLLHGNRHDEGLREKALPLLQQMGFSETFDLEPLTGGGNNRVYQFQHGNEKRVLKVYFQNPADPRDRFGAEKSFYHFLWAEGIRRTPKPFGWDLKNRLGLFSFIEGRKLSAAEIDESLVKQALAFVLESNANKNSPGAEQIPVASEACFSVAEHLAVVERRVMRLQKIECESELDQQAATFVKAELEPAWKKYKSETLQNVRVNLEVQLPQNERCLSPSDFGFHNALLPADGKLRFFDFEYAGWDDPAKLVCDFFCQPQVQVDLKFWKLFVRTLAELEKDKSAFEQRAELLLPAYQIKWCCIMLNEFVRTEQARRDFAKGAASSAERKKAQLEKVRQALAKVKS